MKLNKLRLQIDNIDEEIAKLLNKRFKIVKEIKQLKQATQLALVDQEREASIIAKNSNFIDAEFKQYYQDIYFTVFKASKEYQKQ
ncbi:MAG: hypothetical protein GX149_05750 [Acholeplasmataceae bacterium]|jgi:chorismate mutase|nr:hypothetical protein [Acholeplasmataceae bacterium]